MAEPFSELEVRLLGRIDYEEALHLQERIVATRSEGGGDDLLLLLEHEPVYTIGRTRDQSSLADAKALPHPVVEINRGGQATYHGPGQLVGYPILDLRQHGKDLHALLRFLEETLIEALAAYEVKGTRREGLTGVWIEDRKIASIGVGVRRWISMHGFAINICGDLSPFDSIVPCGISDVAITSLEQELGTQSKVGVEDFAGTVAEVFTRRLPDLG